jgi:hypothetical protein
MQYIKQKKDIPKVNSCKSIRTPDYIYKTGLIPKVTRPVDMIDVYCYEFTARELEEFEANSKAVHLPRIANHTDITDIYCYEFTTDELAEFEENSKAVPLPKVVYPSEIAEVHCYDFTSDENQHDVLECK